MGMDVVDFEVWLGNRDRSDIEWLIDAVAATTETPDGEVERLRATREVVRLLQRSGRRRQAREAQHRVRLCALAVCASTGVLDLDRTGTTQVARAAGDVANALVAGPDAPCSEILIRPFLGAARHELSGHRAS